MNSRALAMPEYVAELVRLTLVRLSLHPEPLQDDMVTCSLSYENGTVISLVVMCVAERRWFRERPAVLVSFVELDQDTRATKVYHTETLTAPTGPGDFPFILHLATKVRARAWTLAVTAGLGECLDLPGRHNFG